ncbi:MAG: class I SAM-dependent methyltransferase [Candidatus Methylomirabilales bacterium]
MATPPPADLSAFRAFEHAGWEDTTPRYHHSLGGLTTQTIGPLLDAMRVGERVRLLDVATGPGYAAAAAAQRGTDAVGIDFSAAMVAQARQHHPTVEFREGDAEALPFPDERFDAVVINFGLLHFGQPERALVRSELGPCSARNPMKH